MSKVTAKIKEEFLAVLPPTIFFFVALHIVALVRMLMNKGTNLQVTTSISGPHPRQGGVDRGHAACHQPLSG